MRNTSFLSKAYEWFTLDEDYPVPAANFALNTEGFPEKVQIFIHEQQKQALLDNLNVLYVACTRAKRMLYLSFEVNKTEKNQQHSIPFESLSKMLHTFFKAHQKENDEVCVWGDEKRLKAYDKEEIKAENPVVINKELGSWLGKIAVAETYKETYADSEEIQFGIWLHSCLENIYTSKDLERAIQKSSNTFVWNSEVQAQIKKSIQNLLNHPELALSLIHI